MQPKDLLAYLEKGDRTKEDLKNREGGASLNFDLSGAMYRRYGRDIDMGQLRSSQLGALGSVYQQRVGVTGGAFQAFRNLIEGGE